MIVALRFSDSEIEELQESADFESAELHPFLYSAIRSNVNAVRAELGREGLPRFDAEEG